MFHRNNEIAELVTGCTKNVFTENLLNWELGKKKSKSVYLCPLVSQQEQKEQQQIVEYVTLAMECLKVCSCETYLSECIRDKKIYRIKVCIFISVFAERNQSFQNLTQ